jgi:hypothetical protein
MLEWQYVDHVIILVGIVQVLVIRLALSVMLHGYVTYQAIVVCAIYCIMIVEQTSVNHAIILV